MWLIPLSEYFNSQPHEEADGGRGDRPALWLNHFNSQPHEEADLFLCVEGVRSV